MDKHDIIRGLEYYYSATERSSTETVFRTYAIIERDQLVNANGTTANVVWKTAQYLVVPRNNSSLAFNLQQCIDGWFQFYVGDKQILILQDDSDKWTYYERVRNGTVNTYNERYNNNEIEELITQIDKNKILSNSFYNYCKNKHLYFSLKLIQRFIASLCTKPFVILTGLSGSGKTRLALEFAKWITDKQSIQYKVIAVGADWTNREPLLGYPNALDKSEYVKPENKALDLILEANKSLENNDNKQYFLILDEMNLSHVERYFSDFLSAMESGLNIELHNSDSIVGVPKSVGFPKNLFVIGTVNIDETTYMFSPKVLDRANTIEFRLTEDEMKNYISNSITTGQTTGNVTTNKQDTLKKLAQNNTSKTTMQDSDLLAFFTELKKIGAEFGYRTVNEIRMLMYKLELLGVSKEGLLDIAIMQKLLPKVHGSRSKLTKLLPVLGELCLKDKSNIKENYLDKYASNNLNEGEINTDSNIKYKISFEKICRMYKNSIENGFASYAEA